MKTHYPWSNNCTRLFCTDGETPQWLFGAVWRVLWRGKNERVILHGILPYARWLDEFPENCTLEIQYRECGDPRKYIDGATVMWFEQCTVRNKWIPKPVIRHPEDAAAIEMFVEVDCKIKIHWEVA